MNAYDYDLFVIGAGSGGVRAARISAGYGARVAIAEEYRVGGTCVIRGCVPKKLLVYGAHFAEDLEDARHFGWAVESKRFDWATLQGNVLSEVDRLNKAYISTLESQKVTILHGRAVLEDAHTVRIGDRTVTADKVLIATGARPGIPDCEGAEHGITSNEVFHLETLPKRVVIAGGGYIANEFAGIFNAFGVKVTLLLRSDRLLREYDQQLAERLQAISTAKGIDFRFNAPFRKVEKQANSSLLIHAGNDDPIETDLLVYAIGRPPNSAGLGLEAIGVALAENGAIKVDADSRTNIGNIYAVGDVTDRVQLTPVAIREGHAFADTVFGGKPWRVDHGCIPSAVFSHPPIAAVGLTEAQARNTYGSVRVYASDFRPMKNVLANRSERSLYKLVVDEASGRILGAHIIGPEAADIMQPLAIAVKAGLTKTQLDETVAIHPTMAEELVLMR
ncbi:MAG: glutathione-disulfide reductase [Sphingomonadaceae bacterium]|nr:glutathione-disulfide reductase [Sphingomonadaceae bacterium]